MEFLSWLRDNAPQYLTAGTFLYILIRSGALKELFSKNGKYVVKEECHGHIDGLNKKIDETRVDLKDHINGVDKKVDMLLQKALQ